MPRTLSEVIKSDTAKDSHHGSRPIIDSLYPISIISYFEISNLPKYWKTSVVRGCAVSELMFFSAAMVVVYSHSGSLDSSHVLVREVLISAVRAHCSLVIAAR